MNKRERNRLIKQISQASGIAQYALQHKMTDEEVSEAASNLNVLALIKSANIYNRYCQAQKTSIPIYIPHYSLSSPQSVCCLLLSCSFLKSNSKSRGFRLSGAL